MPATMVAALAAGLLTATAPTAHAAAGATLPFTSVEAESATTGTRIGPDHTQGTLASEASGRQAVRLGSGQRVEFTVPRAANAVNVVVYSVPDGQSGSLNGYVNGTRPAKTIPVTSKYSYVDTPWIPGAKTHHFYDCEDGVTAAAVA